MCVICDHRSVADINSALRDGVPLLHIEKNYGVARASLHRHRDGGHHLSTPEMEVYTMLSDVDTSASVELEPAPEVDLPAVELTMAPPAPRPVERVTEPVVVAPKPAPVEPPNWTESKLNPTTARLVREEQARLAEEAQRRAEKAERLARLAAMPPAPQPEVDLEQLRALQTFIERYYPPLSTNFEDQVRQLWEVLGWPRFLIDGDMRGGSPEQGWAYIAELRTRPAALRLEVRIMLLDRYHQLLEAVEA